MASHRLVKLGLARSISEQLHGGGAGGFPAALWKAVRFDTVSTNYKAKLTEIQFQHGGRRRACGCARLHVR